MPARMFSAGVRESEKSKSTRCSCARGRLGDADVVGLDVAVRDALLLEPVDGLEQVLAEALEQLEVEAALVAQALGERLVAGLRHEEAGAVAELAASS